MLRVHSDGEDEATFSKKFRADIWAAFLAHGSTHSQLAITLPYIIRRCEREQVPYRLTAMPGTGYHIEPVKQPEQNNIGRPTGS